MCCKVEIGCFLSGTQDCVIKVPEARNSSGPHSWSETRELCAAQGCNDT